MSRKNSTLFKPYMSRALMDRAKTQTRRVDTGKDIYQVGDICAVRENFRAEAVFDKLKPSELFKAKEIASNPVRAKAFTSGELREISEHKQFAFWYDAGGCMSISADGVRDQSDFEEIGLKPGKLRPAIFIPDAVTRQTIVMESVRKEPLLGISDEDAIAEGVRKYSGIATGASTSFGAGFTGSFYAVAGLEEQTKSDTPCGSYFKLWDLINGPDSHWQNPIVNVWTFTHWPVNFEEVR